MEKKSSWYGLAVLLVLISAVGVKAHSPREIEKLLKKLNKPAIKTIESPDGDIIDCVDIYKQPAFDHPLLKNHTIEMRPNFSPEKTESGNYSDEFLEQIWRRHESCPKGTIPIRRVQKSDLVRYESLGIFGAVYPNLIGAGSDRGRNYGYSSSASIGVGATISIWAPTVERTEYSAALVHVGNDQNNINIGWMTNENIFPNSEPRLIVSYGEIARWAMWVNSRELGYYPLSMFSGFNQANNVHWHGRILNKRLFGKHTITQMGSGMLLNSGYKRSAHFQNIHYIDENHDIKYSRNGIQIIADYPHCYNAMFSEPQWGCNGYTVFFGGPGRPYCDQP